MAALFAFLPLTAAAQIANIFSGSFGGPNTNITIINNTSDNSPIMPTIEGRTGRIIWQGNSFEYGFGPYTNGGGEIQIEVQVCSETQTVYQFNSAPSWPDNIAEPNGLAITDAWLRTEPTKNDLRERVEIIKRFMHDQPGGGDYISQLKSWLKDVDKHGIARTGDSCVLPYTIPAIAFNWAMYNAYGGNVETVITVVGNRKDGYHIQNPPRWVQ